MKRKPASIAIAALIITTIVVLLAAGGLYMYRVSTYKSIISNIVITNPDLMACEDGWYEGSFDAIMVTAKVGVAIEDHRIVKIDLLHHKTDRGESAEPITEHVLAAQSLEVDTISGATNSSKVILKAIEDALEQAQVR